MLSPKVGAVVLAFVIVLNGIQALPKRNQRNEDFGNVRANLLVRKTLPKRACATKEDCEGRQGEIEKRLRQRKTGGEIVDQQQDTGRFSHKRFREDSAHFDDCPPGLWCKKKRDISKRFALALGLRSSLDVPGCPAEHWCKKKRKVKSITQVQCQDSWCRRDALLSCPPGLWCKRKRDQEGAALVDKRCPAGLRCLDKANEDYARDAGYQRFDALAECPPGLWCKREAAVMRGCPPGLWCKRSIGDKERRYTTYLAGKRSRYDSKRKPSSFAKRNPAKRNSVCPPGLWCKRGLEKRVARMMGFENSESIEDCPPGLWCKRQDLDKDEKADETACPPGLWCKRNIGRSEAPATGYETADTMNECPPGLWCKRGKQENHDRVTAHADIMNSPVDCPTGFKCKRNLRKSDAIAMGYEMSDTLPECPDGLLCKRDGNEELNLRKKYPDLPCPPGLWC